MKVNELKQLIKEEINNVFLSEKLGVPSNITRVGSQLFDEYLAYVKGANQPLDLETQPLNANDSDNGFDIADLHIDNISIETNIDNRYDELVFAGMGVASLQRFKSDSNLRLLPPRDLDQFKNMEMAVRLGAPSSVEIDDIYNFLIANKPEIVGSFAHELKHWYDGYKNVGGIKARDRAQYAASINFPDRSIGPVNDFIYMLYFISGIESLVRASELAAEMEDQGLTKKDFYDYLVQNKVFKELKKIKEWSYGKFREDLKQHIPTITSILKHTNTPTKGLSEDQLIDKFLEILLYSFTRSQIDELINIIQDPLNIAHMFSALFGQPTTTEEDKEAFEKQVKLIARFGVDYEKYFKYNEKLFHMLGNNVIKKISKTYDLLPD
jgi:hypothetical protein